MIKSTTSTLSTLATSVNMSWIMDDNSRNSHGWHVPTALLRAQNNPSMKVQSVWLPKVLYKPIPSNALFATSQETKNCEASAKD